MPLTTCTLAITRGGDLCLWDIYSGIICVVNDQKTAPPPYQHLPDGEEETKDNVLGHQESRTDFANVNNLQLKYVEIDLPSHDNHVDDSVRGEVL